MLLKTKLTILFVAFTVISLVLFGAIVFSQAGKTLQAVRLAQLNNIADLKKDKIETFFYERKADLQSTQYFQNIKRNLPVLITHPRQGNNPEYLQAIKELDNQLKTFQTSYGYLDIMLTDQRGRVVYVSDETGKSVHLGQLLPDSHTFEEGKKDVYFSDVFFNKDMGNVFEMFGIAPITDFKGNFIGEVLIEIDMGPIYKFIQDSTGLGESGEALIDRLEGNEVLFLSPLRHDPDAALKKKASFNNKIALAAQKAALGETGSGITSDYRGAEVLAAWRYLPSLRWGLVTKIDAVEALAPVNRLKLIVITVGAFIVLIGAFAALLVSRTITGPLFRLQKGAEAVAAGDLNHHVGTGADDEIGRLSRSFNTMTENLRGSYANLEKEIEERKEMNEELQRTATLLDETQAIAQVGGWEVDLVENTLFWTEETYRIHETSPSEYRPTVETAIAFYAPESVPVISSAVKEAIEQGKDFSLELQLITAKGRLIWVEAVGKAIRRDGRTVKVLGAFRDVTERKQAEAIRLANAYNRSLLEASLDPLVTISADGKITDVNKATERVTGRDREELIGTDFSDYFTEPAKARAGYQQVFREGSVMDYALEIKSKDGHLTPVLYNAAVYRDEAGNVTGVFAAARDITERKKAEEEIKKLNRELEARVVERTVELENSNRELEAFAYSVSHDLRAPLRGIEGFSLALLEDYADKLDDVGKNYLDRVRKATLRMGQLIDDLLKLSRVTRSEMNREQVNLSAIAKDISARLKQNYPDRNAQFIIADGLTAYGDERLLAVVLENLFANAWKFSEKSAPSVIEFGVAQKDGANTYFVRDNGAGFDMAYSGKLFSPFQRLHKIEEFPGTGIGLATVKRVINRHGGKVWIEAEVGKGATVYFTL